MKNKIIGLLVLSILFAPLFLSAQTHSLSGKLHRHNFDPEEGIQITATYNTDTVTVVADANGGYNFTGIPTGTEVTLSYDGLFDPYEGVNVLDLMVLRDWILQLWVNSSPLQALAGDLNNSAGPGQIGVSGIDAVFMGKLALRFTENTLTDSIWQLVPVELIPGEDTIPETFVLTVNEDIMGYDFVAIKAGDTAIDSDYLPAPAAAPSPALKISNESFVAGEEVVFDIRVEDFSGIVACQQTLQWDTMVLEWQGTSGPADFGYNPELTDKGWMPFFIQDYNSWWGGGSTTYEDGETLFSITFTALVDSDSMNALQFADTLALPQMVWSDQQLNLYIVDGTYINEDPVIEMYSVSGKLERHNFDPVEGVQMTVVYNSGTVTTITNANGEYLFEGIPAGSEVVLFSESPFDPYEGVSVLDVMVARDWTLQLLANSTPLQALASDMNNNNPTGAPIEVGAFDMAVISKLALQMSPDFSIDSSWILVPLALTPGVDPIYNTFSLTVNEDVIDYDFVAVKQGDSAMDPDYLPAPPEASNPIFTISEESFEAGEELVFEITVEDFAGIAACQNTLKWDPTKLEWLDASTDLSVSLNFNPNHIDQGLMPFIVEDFTFWSGGSNIPDEEVLFTLTFNTLAPSTAVPALQFSDTLTLPQVVWANNNLEFFIVDGIYLNETTTGLDALSIASSFEIKPNPAQYYTYVNSELENMEFVELSVKNMLGQKVFSKKMETDVINERIDFEDMVVGTYVISVRTSEGILSKVFVRQ